MKSKSIPVEIYQKSVKKLAQMYTETSFEKIVRVEIYQKSVTEMPIL